MNPDKKMIGSRIKGRREKYSFEVGQRITQKILAEKIGISQSYLGDIESGRTKPSPEILQKIAQELKSNVDFLLGLTDIPYDEKTYGKLKADAKDSLIKDDYQLKKKDERDIAKDLRNTLDCLNSYQQGLMFDGEPIDEETKELLRISLENSMRLAKQIAKQKYTPNKYK